MEINRITGLVIRASMKVHSLLGPGLFESAYTVCLRYELQRSGLLVRTEVPMPIEYDGVKLSAGYRADLIVERQVLVELKAVAKLMPVHELQLLSYLRLSGYRVGLLLNFHQQHMRDGIRRFANRL
jgi:GxxExxY protein